LKENEYTHKPLLTKREREVFELLVQEKTVRNHISNAMQKLGVKGRSQAVIELLRMGELKL
jgi:LuxR family transcriptional regulator of spore coat protein